MRKANIEELLRGVAEMQQEREKRATAAIRKRVEKLQEYSKERGLNTVERIPVLPEIKEEEVAVNKFSNTTVKVYSCPDKNIIKSIQAINPEHIESKLYWFNNGNYLFTTDRGAIYNLRSYPRGLSESEKEFVTNSLLELEEERLEIEEKMRKAKVLVASITPAELRTTEQIELAASLELSFLYFELEPAIKRERKFCCYSAEECIYGAEFAMKTNQRNLNIYGETAEYSVIKSVVNDVKKEKEEYLKKIETTFKKITDIKEQCESEPQYYIHPMASNKQIKIYIPKFSIKQYEIKGYSVHEVDREEEYSRYTIKQGKIEEVTNKSTKISYYINMSSTAFKSCCFYGNGKVCNKGFMFNSNGDMVKLIRKATEQVTIMDEQGTVRTFASKTEAAKELKVSSSLISKAIKNANGGIPVVNTSNNQDNKKQFKLLSSNHKTLEFVSMTDAAKKFNTNNMKITRALKNKTYGDKVTINGEVFTLVA